MRVFMLFLLALPVSLWAQVTAVAPELPILVVSDDGVTASGGQSVDMVREACKRAKLDVEVKIQPWPRAVLTATNQPGTLLFPVARTPERQDQFDWLGPVNRLEYQVFRLTEGSAPPVKTADDLRPYRVGVLLGDIADQFLTAHQNIQVEEVRNYDILVNLLFAQRVDYLAVVPSSLYSALRQAGKAKTDVVSQFVLPTAAKDPYSYAVMAKGSPTTLVAPLTQAFKTMVADGTWERIFKKYQ